MFDIIIKNGVIIDGSGAKKYSADLGIKGDKIEKIENLKETRAKKIIDGKGLYIAPGFIDIHNHSDSYWTLFKIPRLESLITQGITTIIGGNCGSSLAPLVDQKAILSIQKWADVRELNFNWLSMEEFFRELENKKLGLNFGTLVGHSTLRRGILKDEIRPLKKEELKKIQLMLEKALNKGAFGLSTGLVYSHAKLAPTEEIISLAKIVKKYNGFYASHIRGEAEEFIPAINETLRIARQSNVSTEISHLKVMGRKNWPNMQAALKMIEQAVSEGVKINFDIYPYTITGSVLYTLLPDWVAEGGKKIMLSRLKDQAIREKVIKEMAENNFEYDKIIISICPRNKNLVGKKITEIAENENIGIEQAVIDLLIASEGQAICFIDALSEENLKAGLKNSLSIIGSDGSGYNLEHRKTKEMVHPRCFGAFPKILGEYVRQKKILTWEKAIYKMTGKPAEKIGLKKRGKLVKGNFADITIFNPKKITDKADFKNPYQYSEGIEYVLINGRMVIEKSRLTNEMAGRVLRKE